MLRAAQLAGEDDEVDARRQQLKHGDGELWALEWEAPPRPIQAAAHRGAVGFEHRVAAQAPHAGAAGDRAWQLARGQQRCAWDVEEDVAPLAQVAVSPAVGRQPAVRVGVALAAGAHRLVQVRHQPSGELADVDHVLEESDYLLVLLWCARDVEHRLDALAHAQRFVSRHPHHAEARVAAAAEPDGARADLPFGCLGGHEPATVDHLVPHLDGEGGALHAYHRPDGVVGVHHAVEHPVGGA